MTTSTTPNHGLTKYVFSTGARTVRGITKAMNDNWDIIDAELGGTSLLHVEDQRSSGTTSGSVSSGAWRTRPLNMVVTNEITGASLASNQITLPAGDYEVWAYGGTHRVNRWQTRWQNVTDGSTVIVGASRYASEANSVSNASELFGRFTLATEKNLEFQMRVQTNQGTHGFGVNAGGAFTVDHEVYSIVKVLEV